MILVRMRARQVGKMKKVCGELIRTEKNKYYIIECEKTGMNKKCVKEGAVILSENLNDFVEKSKLMKCDHCFKSKDSSEFREYSNGSFSKICKKCVNDKRMETLKKSKAEKEKQKQTPKEDASKRAEKLAMRLTGTEQQFETISNDCHENQQETESSDNNDPLTAFMYAIEAVEGIDPYKQEVDRLEQVYQAKNADYGNSVEQSLNKFGAIAGIVRMSDKMNRLETLVNNERQVNDESFLDSVEDLANYSIMLAMWLREKET